MALPRVAAGQAAIHLRRRSLADREDWLGVLMLAPAMAYVVLLVGVPFLLALVLSFTEATAGRLDFSWVGLRNFADVIGNPLFQRALKNTLIFTLVSEALVIVGAVTMAMILDSGIRGRRVLRFLFLLPWAAPISLSTIGWTWIYDSTFSVINWTLRVLGLLGPGQWLYWFGDTQLTMTAVIVVHVWRMLPFSTVIVMAGRSTLPQEIREAAVVDGAGFWKRLLQVDLPLLLPVVAVAVLFGTVFTATDLSVVWLLNRGGPYNTTHVLASLAYQQGILSGNLGQGAAIALFLFPVLVVVAVVMLRMARRTEVGH